MPILVPRRLTHSTGHINNLYNTTFWALVNRGGMARPTAEKELSVSIGQGEL